VWIALQDGSAANATSTSAMARSDRRERGASGIDAILVNRLAVRIRRGAEEHIKKTADPSDPANGRGLAEEPRMACHDAPFRSSRVAPWNREDAALDARVRRRLFTSRRTMIVVCESRPEPFGIDHQHALDQITLVLRGSVEARIHGAVCTVPEGRSVRVPAGVRHALRCAGPEISETVNFFLAPR
jgi:quercetin dioxygenase-like cupin family protein